MVGEVTDKASIYKFDGDHRVVVTDDMFYVFSDGMSGPELAYSAWIEDFQKSKNPNGYYVITANDGPTFFVKRADSCGCGSMLRGFFPFPDVPHRREIG